MTKRNITKIIAIFCLAVLMSMSNSTVYAQGGFRGGASSGQGEGVSGHGPGGDMHRRAMAMVIFETLPEEERNTLIELRKSDPEKAKEVIRQKIKERGEYLKNLKETDPERFKEIIELARDRVKAQHAARKLVHESFTEEEKEAFQTLREQDPQKARESIEEKVQERIEYLKDLKNTDPEKFVAITEKLYQKGRGRRMVTREIIFESLSDEEKKALVKLRAEDPEKFKAVVEEKLKGKGDYLKNLKETDPEKFKETVKNAQQRIRKRMQALKEKDPEKFKKLVGHARNRRKERLAVLCKDNPEKCKELKEKRLERIKSMLNELKEDSPEVYQDIKDWFKE